MQTISSDQFLAIGKQLFGERTAEWLFVCPVCKHEQSIQQARERQADVPSGWMPYYSCEGRHAEGVGCDYTSGGLFKLCTLQVFDPDRGAPLPCFMFAHPDAERLIGEAATQYEPPQHFTCDATTWDAFPPQDWIRDQSRQGAPVLGSMVTLGGLGRGPHTGRYVHCWNNIGRVITDDGSVEMVSF